MSGIEAANPGRRFVLELCALVALAYRGARTETSAAIAGLAAAGRTILTVAMAVAVAVSSTLVRAGAPA